MTWNKKEIEVDSWMSCSAPHPAADVRFRITSINIAALKSFYDNHPEGKMENILCTGTTISSLAPRPARVLVGEERVAVPPYMGSPLCVPFSEPTSSPEKSIHYPESSRPGSVPLARGCQAVRTPFAPALYPRGGWTQLAGRVGCPPSLLPDIPFPPSSIHSFMHAVSRTRVLSTRAPWVGRWGWELPFRGCGLRRAPVEACRDHTFSYCVSPG